jgi:hypothetical protein
MGASVAPFELKVGVPGNQDVDLVPAVSERLCEILHEDRVAVPFEEWVCRGQMENLHADIPECGAVG